MQRFVYAALLSLSFAALGCGELVNPSTDSGVKNGDGGDIGTCTPDCGDNAFCNAQDSCECSPGYEGDGQTCNDIDECETANGGCDENALCINRPGDRACVCNATHTGDGETCTEVWSLEATLENVNLNPDGFGTLGVFANGQVFFGPETNLVPAIFWRSYDPLLKQFGPELPLPPSLPGDFCACGFTESIVSDGIDVFLLGNEGMRYRTNEQRWENFDAYDSANRRGEAGGTFDSVSGSILLFGGRNNQNNALRIDLSSSLQEIEPGEPPVLMDNAAAHAVPNMPLSFIATPQNNGGVQMLSHQTGTPNWMQLANAPNEMGRPQTMGNLGPQIWVADSEGVLYFFDPMANTWSDTRFGAPAGTEVVVNAGSEIIAIAQDGNAVQAWRLVAQP